MSSTIPKTIEQAIKENKVSVYLNHFQKRSDELFKEMRMTQLLLQTMGRKHDSETAWDNEKNRLSTLDAPGLLAEIRATQPAINHVALHLLRCNFRIYGYNLDFLLSQPPSAFSSAQDIYDFLSFHDLPLEHDESGQEESHVALLRTLEADDMDLDDSVHTVTDHGEDSSVEPMQIDF